MNASESTGPYLSVVIPCWNEERNLESGVLDEVRDYLNRQEYTWEVIIVDDGSTDNSRVLIERFVAGDARFRLLDIPHGGKPAAVWAGIQQAQGEIVLFADMDQSTPIHEVAKLLPWYAEGYDVVIGSRGMAREGAGILRQVGSVVFLGMRRLVLLRGIVDTQCGFKSCRRQAALAIFPHLQYFKTQARPKGWKVSAYDVELLYLLDKAGYRIKEVVVQWYNRDRSVTKSQEGGLTKYIRESLEMAREVMRVKRNDLRGLYDGIDAARPA